jgi:hypothetical protein
MFFKTYKSLLFNIEGHKNKLCFQLIYDDLFSANEDVSLAHCVSEDFSMSQGIAIQFKNRFKRVHKLLAQSIFFNFNIFLT